MDYEILTFTEAQHAFFNDTNPARFNAAGRRAGLAARERLVRGAGHDAAAGRDD